MINNRSLLPASTTSSDHLTPSQQYNSAMATANAIAASINAQSIQNKAAVNSPQAENANSPMVTQNETSPSSTKANQSPAAKEAEAQQPQPIVRVSLEIQLLKAENLYPTPSMADKLLFEDEFDLRLVGCELIQTAGRLLKLSQKAMATGQVLFHRYYYIKSFVRNPMEYYAMAAIFLSSKIEECPRRIRDVMNVFHHIKQVRGGKVIKPMPVDEQYYETKNQVIKAERRMLKELGFCIHFKHPHKIIFIYLQAMQCSEVELSQKAWNFMNDSLRTDIFLRYSPENIVCACIYLSARELKISLPQSPPWFTIFGADEESIKEICVRILHIYSHQVQSQEVLEKKINQINEQINEEKRRLREEKYKAAAINVAAALTSSAQDQKKSDQEEAVSESTKTTVVSSTESLKPKTKFEDRKYPHQHRGSFNTPPDHALPLNASHPYYLNHHASSGGVLPGNPMSRHASFPHYMNYQHHPAYLNGNGGPYPPGADHYQNENYYDVNMRRNKSSNDLITSSHYKDIDEYSRHHKADSKTKSRDRSRDRSRSKVESRDEYSRSKISNQTNKIHLSRSKSRSRSRSPWKREKIQSDKKSRSHHKHVSRSRSRSADSVDSGHSRSSTKHKKKKANHSSSHRKEERTSKDRDRRDRDRTSSHSRHHHKSSKSSRSRHSREREGPADGESRYVPIYS